MQALPCFDARAYFLVTLQTFELWRAFGRVVALGAMLRPIEQGVRLRKPAGRYLRNRTRPCAQNQKKRSPAVRESVHGLGKF